jgi:hypothetical protein
MTEANVPLNENSKVEEIEATILKYEEKLAQEQKEKDDNFKAYLKENQKRLDLQEENKRLKEKLEKKTREELRDKELERRQQREENNLLAALFN